MKPERPSFNELARGVRAYLGQDHRYRHCVRVARCADVLAQRHGVDAPTARVAGMLHDVARLWSPEELIAGCEARGLPIDDFAREHPVVLHAPLGAAIARERFGVRDEAVLSAIEKHTTADAGMSPLDCVVYLADSLEPDRTFDQRAGFWQLALRNLDEAMEATIEQSLAYLRARGLQAAPKTLAALREFTLHRTEAQAFAR